MFHNIIIRGISVWIIEPKNITKDFLFPNLFYFHFFKPLNKDHLILSYYNGYMGPETLCITAGGPFLHGVFVFSYMGYAFSI